MTVMDDLIFEKTHFDSRFNKIFSSFVRLAFPDDKFSVRNNKRVRVVQVFRPQLVVEIVGDGLKQRGQRR